MPIEMHVYVNFVGSDKHFVELHLNQETIKQLGREAGALNEVFDALRSIGKLFGLA